MIIDEKRIYLECLKEKADALTSEPNWNYLFKEHLLQSLELFRLATISNNNKFYRDCISRTNKVLEGVIKLLYNKAESIDSSLNARDTLFHTTQELLNHNKISNIFKLKLDSYRQILRNPETHQVFINFGVNDAETAINEALVFLNIGIEDYKIIEEQRDPIDNMDYLYLLVDSFVECFAIYSQFFSLYDKRYNGIYSANVDVLVKLFQVYYENSIFSREFAFTKHESKNKFRPHFKVSLVNSNITFNIIKISDFEMATFESLSRLGCKEKKYQSTFINLYFLIWSFTNRSRLNEVIALFEGVPHFHIDGLNKAGSDDLQKKLGGFMMF